MDLTQMEVLESITNHFEACQAHKVKVPYRGDNHRVCQSMQSRTVRMNP